MSRSGLASDDSARLAPLDLHEGIVEPPVENRGCERWPEHLRLLNLTSGELVRGRCRATNLCRYCQRLYVLETVEMLKLDALEYAPTIWVVLTAREHLTRAECRQHLEALRRAARARYPLIEWHVEVEFQRRGALHLNLLIKGVPVAELDELRGLVVERWCARVDALPVGQWAGAIADGGGVIAYLAKTLAHGLKAEQAPPIGWRGHRTSQTRGYLVRPASAMRLEARASVRARRRLWRAMELVGGGNAQAVEQVAEQLEAAERDAVWKLQGSLGGRDPERVMVEQARAPFAALRGSHELEPFRRRLSFPRSGPKSPANERSGVEGDASPSGWLNEREAVSVPGRIRRQ